jgi:hypothetical protein
LSEEKGIQILFVHNLGHTLSLQRRDLSGKLSKELKKFGIASTTNGISDTTYKSISTALEMQRSVLMSQIHGDERQIVECERDAVVWHTQMAVRDRDLVIVKSPSNVVTDSDSDHSNASEYSVEEVCTSLTNNYSRIHKNFICVHCCFESH